MLNFTNVTHLTLMFAFHVSLPRKFTYSSSSLAKAKATNWGFNPVRTGLPCVKEVQLSRGTSRNLSLIHISEPTRPLYTSYAVFCLKKKRPTSWAGHKLSEVVKLERFEVSRKREIRCNSVKNV